MLKNIVKGFEEMMNSIMAAFNESYNDKYAGWNEGEELLKWGQLYTEQRPLGQAWKSSIRFSVGIADLDAIKQAV